MGSDERPPRSGFYLGLTGWGAVAPMKRGGLGGGEVLGW